MGNRYPALHLPGAISKNIFLLYINMLRDMYWVA